MKARSILVKGIPYGADGRIFTADEIVGGRFIEVMICILRLQSNFMISESIDEFVDEAGKYFGKTVYDIGNEKSQYLLDKFKELIEG